jgi:hypothetical protein
LVDALIALSIDSKGKRRAQALATAAVCVEIEVSTSAQALNVAGLSGDFDAAQDRDRVLSF